MVNIISLFLSRNIRSRGEMAYADRGERTENYFSRIFMYPFVHMRFCS